MREMIEFDFMEGIKKLKYITKINEQTWFIRRDKNSICESFWVTLIPGGLCMSGDYGGVIVRPFTRSNWETIGWMAGATTLGYFAEKVMLGNQHHQSKEYDTDYAVNQLVDVIVSRYEIEHMKNMIREAFYTRPKLDMIALRAKEINDEFSEKYIEEIKNITQDCYDAYLEFEHNFYEFCQELEIKYNFHDMWEMGFRKYTRQIQWQQHCLLWWARNILLLRDGQNPNNIEYAENKD